MRSWGDTRAVTRTVVGIVVCSLVLGATAAGAGAGSSSEEVGKYETGALTDVALENPKCDPTTGRFRLEFFAAPPCVKEWKAGNDNGGKTAQGVTADSIKVVVLYERAPAASRSREAGVYTNQATGKNEVDAARACATRRERSVQARLRDVGTHRRVRVRASRPAPTRPRSAPTRSAIKAMKPFGVLDLASSIGTPGIGGGRVFEQTLVERGGAVRRPAADRAAHQLEGVRTDHRRVRQEAARRRQGRVRRRQPAARCRASTACCTRRTSTSTTSTRSSRS